MELPDHGGALGICVKLDVVTDTIGRPEATDSANPEALLLHDSLQNLQSILMQFGSLLADLGIRKQAGITAAHLPCGKEG